MSTTRTIACAATVVAVLAVLTLMIPASSRADAYEWSSDFYGCGFDAYVSDVVEWNGNLIACGRFTHQSGVPTDHVGMWTGSEWLTMGPTSYNIANQLGVYGSDLYILGQVPNAFSPRPLMRWNGGGWDLAFSFTQFGYSGVTRAMLEYNGLLIVAGDIGVGYTGARDLVTFDGTNVGDIAGKPLLNSGSEVVFDMVEFQGDLFATGSFEMTLDSVATSGIIRWDGFTWSPVEGRSAPAQPLVEGLSGGSGLTFGRALAVHDNKLYIAGDFTMAGDLPVSNIVSWDPATELWEDVGGGSPTPVRVLSSYGGNLYAGGELDSIGGIGVNNIAQWNGSAWSGVSTGTSGIVLTMAPYGGDLVIGGEFATAGTAHAANLAWWDGSSFYENNAPCGDGMDNTVQGLSEFQGDLIAMGFFEYAGDTKVNYVGAYDGGAWSSLGGGANDYVYNSASDGTQLVVGGKFTEIGGVPASYIASWNGSVWSALDDGAPGENPEVCFHEGDLYAAGRAYCDGVGWSAFVRRWDGSSWTDLLTPGSNLKGQLASYDGMLYLGYDRYDGSTWSVVPCGYTEFTTRMVTVCDGELYITSLGSQNVCAGPLSMALVFDGTSSSGLSPNSLGPPYSSDTPYDIVSFDGLRLMGGQGNYDGGRIWYHDGVASQWEVFAGDVNSTIYDMQVIGNTLYIGGFFNAVGTIYDDGSGTASSKIGSISNVVSAADSPAPERLQLSQNIPNPFNPATAIHYVTTGGTTSLVIYDVRGRRVRTLVDGDLPAGGHTAEWDGRNQFGQPVASGVYFYRLRTNGETLVRKMVLSK